jgi:hypothetical protein
MSELPDYMENETGRYWRVNGKSHRDDGPAVITVEGSQTWFQHGVIRRKNNGDGPSHIGVDGTQWWTNEKGFHRDDGPAIIYPDGARRIQGFTIHRDDEPNNRNQWFINDHPITANVRAWLAENNISYPFTDEEKVLFKLTFC